MFWRCAVATTRTSHWNADWQSRAICTLPRASSFQARAVHAACWGRGGSDTSAAYLAARLQACALEIWTDVPGIFSADPRVVPEARLLKRLSYSEAQELASMGARVLHPPSIQPARRHGIPIYIKDTNRPEEPGTHIGARTEHDEARVKGVVSRAGVTLISMENPAMWQQAGIDLDRLDQLLGNIIAGHDVDLWLEPGRYLVAESGVLLSRVTQLKTKGKHHYLGVSTGMNSLIRPALYGAYHDIVNLSRLDEAANQHYRVVGPICESGDVLGESRFLPTSTEGDIILIANTGAYGRVMSSSYNRRAPAEEYILE